MKFIQDEDGRFGLETTHEEQDMIGEGMVESAVKMREISPDMHIEAFQVYLAAKAATCYAMRIILANKFTKDEASLHTSKMIREMMDSMLEDLENDPTYSEKGKNAF